MQQPLLQPAPCNGFHCAAPLSARQSTPTDMDYSLLRSFMEFAGTAESLCSRVVASTWSNRVAFVAIGVSAVQFVVWLANVPQKIRSTRRREHDHGKCEMNVSLCLVPGSGPFVKCFCACVTNRARGWIARCVSLGRASRRRLHSCAHAASIIRRPVVAQVARPNAARLTCCWPGDGTSLSLASSLYECQCCCVDIGMRLRDLTVAVFP